MWSVQQNICLFKHQYITNENITINFRRGSEIEIGVQVEKGMLQVINNKEELVHVF